jgi:hypothetical protein
LNRLIAVTALLLAAAPAFALDEFNARVGGGKSMTSWHGQASFRTIEFEVTGRSRLVERWLPKARVGASVAYHDIRQPRSWFGYLYGDPNDSVRGESAYLFVRQGWRAQQRVRPYVELGTGPMWSNRRVPAATSRLNFNSQIGLGVNLFSERRPLNIVYRFAHISNLMFGDNNPGQGPRNPGWNVSSLLIGTRVRTFRR